MLVMYIYIYIIWNIQIHMYCIHIYTCVPSGLDVFFAVSPLSFLEGVTSGTLCARSGGASRGAEFLQSVAQPCWFVALFLLLFLWWVISVCPLMLTTTMMTRMMTRMRMRMRMRMTTTRRTVRIQDDADDSTNTKAQRSCRDMGYFDS